MVLSIQTDKIGQFQDRGIKCQIWSGHIVVFYSWINPEQHRALFIIMLSVSESLFPHCSGGCVNRKCSVFSERHCKLKLCLTLLHLYCSLTPLTVCRISQQTLFILNAWLHRQSPLHLFHFRHIWSFVFESGVLHHAAQEDHWCNQKLPSCQFVNSILSSLSLNRNCVSIKCLVLNKTEKNLTNNILIILLTFSAYSGDLQCRVEQKFETIFCFFWTESKIMISEPQLMCVGSSQCHHKPLQTLRIVPVQRAL